MARACGGEKVRTLTSRTDRPWTFPVGAYGYAIDRMRAIQARRDTEGKEMLPGWEREYRYHAWVKELIEWIDQAELEKTAAADRRGKR